MSYKVSFLDDLHFMQFVTDDDCEYRHFTEWDSTIEPW